MSQRVELLFCAACAGGPDEVFRADLQSELAANSLPVTVRLQECMNVCDDPVTLALQGECRATCLFSGVDPQTDRADIVATVRAYLQSPGGWIEDARPCGRLRFCLRGRVPAFLGRNSPAG